jgi:hypothetical protein
MHEDGAVANAFESPPVEAGSSSVAFGRDRWEFPEVFPEIQGRPMANARKQAVATYRKRMRRRGLVRVEVHVRKEDAPLVRGVAGALADPAQAPQARAMLRERFGPRPGQGLKALLAGAPLEGIDLERSRDRGRTVRL